MPADIARYDDLIHGIYDAALNPSSWPGVLEHISNWFGSSHSQLFTLVHGPAHGGFVFSHNISQSMIERWALSAIDDDPLSRSVVSRGLMVRGNAVVGHELAPVEVLRRSRLYRELWEPMGIDDVCCGIVFDGVDSHTLPVTLCTYRRHEDQAFDDGTKRMMRRLLAHLSRSVGVMLHLRDHQLQVASSLAALQRLSAGVALIGVHGHVQFANAAAETIFRRADPLALAASSGNAASSRLTLTKRLHSLESQFKRLIELAVEPLCPSGCPSEHFSKALVLPDAEGKPSCVLQAAPLGKSEQFAADNRPPRAIVFIYDIAAAVAVPPALLIELFDFTRAEARTALEVMQGGSAVEIAERLGVSINTVKTQLKAVYAKSRTRGHADLLKLLLALASN